jgi:hypothetical protein
VATMGAVHEVTPNSFSVVQGTRTGYGTTVRIFVRTHYKGRFIVPVR